MVTPDTNQDLLLEEGTRLREKWELVKKQHKIIYFFTGLILLGSFIYIQVQKPQYMATGILLIESEGSSQMNLVNQSYSWDNDWTKEYLNTQIRILTSRALAREVINEFRLLPKKDNKQPADDAVLQILQGTMRVKDEHLNNAEMSWAINAFLRNLSVSNALDTRLLEVSYISADPNMAAHSLNTLFDKFIDFNLEIKSKSSKQASEFLTLQIEELRRGLSQKEVELQEYGKRKELYYLQGQDNTEVQKFSSLNNAFTFAQIERINREAYFRELNGKSYENFIDVRNSPLVQNLKQECTTRESEYRKKQQIFQDSYPEMQRLRTQLDMLQKRLADETNDIAQKVLKQAEGEYQAALKKEKYLQDLIDQQKGRVVSSNTSAIYFNSLRIEVDNMRNMLDFLTRKQKESMLSARLEGLQTSNIKIVDRPEIPWGPFSPDKKKIMLIALLLGLAGGLAIIFGLHYLDDTVKSPEDVQKLLHVPALGFIPDVNTKPGSNPYRLYYSARKPQAVTNKSNSIELVNITDPESTFSEHYRYIRTSLMLATPETLPKVIVITSAMPQEGKTATTINLAAAFTQLGKKVLAIDCDMRRPRLHKIFNFKNTEGISSYLVGRNRIEDVIQRCLLEPKLHIIPSGPIPPNPVELIISKGMSEIMAKLRQQYDFIFIDAPPLMGIQDAILLSEHADGLMLVALSGKTPRKVIEKARDEISKFNIKLLGLVLNKVNMRKLTSTYYSYSYKYGGYHESEEKTKEG